MSEITQTKRGYFVDIPRTNIRRNHNAVLRSTQGTFYLYVFEITANFAMGGSVGQSEKKRDFFARNFVQPSFTIRGQAPNSAHYNELALFVRRSQKADLRGAGRGRAKTRFLMPDTSNAMARQWQHKSLVLEGFIGTVAAGAIRFENSPEYQFDFLVSQSVQGIYKEQAPTINKLPGNISSVMQRGRTFAPDPDSQPDRDNLSPDGGRGNRGSGTGDTINGILGGR